MHACLHWQACVAMGSDAGLYYDSLFMLPMLSSLTQLSFLLLNLFCGDLHSTLSLALAVKNMLSMTSSSSRYLLLAWLFDFFKGKNFKQPTVQHA